MELNSYHDMFIIIIFLIMGVLIANSTTIRSHSDKLRLFEKDLQFMNSRLLALEIKNEKNSVELANIYEYIKKGK